MSGRAIAVGNFDGVHRGHRLVLDELVRLARQRGLDPAVVTFTSHPLALVAPERAPRLLQGFDERKILLEQAGMQVIALDFTDELRRLSAKEFLELLRDRFDARLLLLGHDNRFGYRAPGEAYSTVHPAVELYGSLCPDLEVVEAPRLPGVSSSAVRKAVAAGDMERAAEMLGRPFAYTARVIGGKRLGRTIGFPTANLVADTQVSDVADARAVRPCKSQLLLPETGVYFCRAWLEDGSAWPAMVNIGCRPTVDGECAPISVEAHLDGFSGDLYDQQVKLEFLHRHRPERRFPSLEALRVQLAADLTALRDYSSAAGRSESI